MVVCVGMGEANGNIFVCVGNGTGVDDAVVVGKDSVIVIAVREGSGDEVAGGVYIDETSLKLS